MKCIQNYTFDTTSKPLGKGAFGTVYKGIDTRNSNEVAIKVIPTDLLQKEDYTDLLQREIQVLRQIKGDNIVQLLDTFRTANNLYVIMDFCNGGDLEAYLKKNGSMSEDKALEVAYQFCNAFNTINNLHITDSRGHKLVIMHRDLKTANVLFHNGIIKIADFGFAKMVDEALKDRKIHHTILGTPLYMAPQILDGKAYTAKCDIWSTGLIIYECIYGVLPWNGVSYSNLLKNINTQPLKFSNKIRNETIDLIEKMLQIDESKRISWSDMLKHPAIKAAQTLFETKYNPKPQKPLILIEDASPKENMMTKPTLKRIEPENPINTNQGLINIPTKYETKTTITTIETTKKTHAINLSPQNTNETVKLTQETTPLKAYNRYTIGGDTAPQRNTPLKTKKPGIFEEQKNKFDNSSDNTMQALRKNIDYTPKSDPQKYPAKKIVFEDTANKIILDKQNPETPTRRYIPIFSPKPVVARMNDPNPWDMMKAFK